MPFEIFFFVMHALTLLLTTANNGLASGVPLTQWIKGMYCLPEAVLLPGFLNYALFTTIENV